MRSSAIFGAAERWISAGLLLLLVTACTATPTATPGPTPVDINLNSFSLTPSNSSVPAGPVTFNATNAAASDAHEMVVIQTDLAADQLPVADDSTVDEDTLTVIDEIAEMAPGGTGSLTVDLAAGHYVLICNVPGHYSQGMHADFTVNP